MNDAGREWMTPGAVVSGCAIADSTIYDLSVSARAPDLRTADEIAADRDAELKAQLAALANEVTALRDAMHAQAQIVQALWLAHELAGDA